MKDRPAHLFAETAGKGRSAGEIAAGDDECAVGIADVRSCAHGRVAGSSFIEAAIDLRYSAVFGPFLAWHPTADRDAGLKCGVPSGAVNTRLAACYYPFKIHGSLGEHLLQQFDDALGSLRIEFADPFYQAVPVNGP